MLDRIVVYHYKTEHQCVNFEISIALKSAVQPPLPDSDVISYTSDAELLDAAAGPSCCEGPMPDPQPSSPALPPIHLEQL